MDTTVRRMTEREVEASYGHNITDDREVEASYGHNSKDGNERGGSHLWTLQYG